MNELIEQIEETVREFYNRAAPDTSNRRVSLAEPMFDHREVNRAIRTILSGWISQGPNVAEFERRFARYVGCEAAVAVNSGSSANLVVLLALRERLGLEDGDEVILPAAAFATVAAPVIQAGLTPVYVDVRRETLNIDPRVAEEALSPRSRVLMPVHTLGYPAEMEALGEIAARAELTVFEDCCEAHGASIDGKRVGSFGAVGTYSFFVAHNMTTGEGGMIVTDDAEIERLARSLREFGRVEQRQGLSERFFSDDVLTDFDRRYVFERLGLNVRMTDVAAAFGIEQLAKLDGMNDTRRGNAARLRARLTEIADFVEVPVEAPGYFHTYYGFPMLLTEKLSADRIAFTVYLEERGIETRPLFAGCLPDQPAFRAAPGRVVGSLEISRMLRDRMVFVGIHPALTEEQVDFVADTVTAFVRDHT